MPRAAVSPGLFASPAGWAALGRTGRVLVSAAAMLESLRRARSFLVLSAITAGVAALGACGGGGSSGAAGDDSGAGDEGPAVGHDATATDSSGHEASSGGDTGSGGDTSVDSAGGSSGGDAGNDGGDASFSFDGFAHLDGYSEAAYCPDDDGDGWTVCGGDCNDHDSLVNPCAFDTNDPTDPVGSDGIDNDCDGTVDNLVTCENGLAAGHDPTAANYAHASDLCDNPRCTRLVAATWYGPNIANAKRVTGHMGSGTQFKPHQGSLMSLLSSGTADDDVDTAGYLTCPGTDFGVKFNNPMPLPKSQNINPCNTGVDESGVEVHDYTELRMTVKAPINAGSYAFDFAFFSEEYPVYVCQGYNDTFLAIQTSQQFPSGQQIAYDANNHRINVNNAFFQDCNSCVNCVPGYTFTVSCNPNSLSLLNGTSYEKLLGPSSSPPSQCNLSHGSGGTDWLKTTSPIVPSEQFTLSWIVFDEADGILDSAVILDHFHWHSTTLGSPVTGR
jgi:hypothetical protein